MAATVKPFTCQQCGHSFTRSHGLRRHIDSVHEKKSTFTCDICKKSFTLKSVLVDHMLTHSEAKPFDCSLCDEAFKSRRSRSRHLRKIHSVEEDGEESDTVLERTEAISEPPRKKQRQLAEAVAAAAAATAASVVAPVSTLPLPSHHLCGICQLSFSSDSLLSLHVAQEHGERISTSSSASMNPRESELDGSSSSSDDEDEPSIKTRTNTKKRPHPKAVFQCTYEECERTFHYRHVLQNHIRAVHTLETPFACNVCEKQFPTLARRNQCEKTHLRL